MGSGQVSKKVQNLGKCRKSGIQASTGKGPGEYRKGGIRASTGKGRIRVSTRKVGSGRVSGR